MLTCIICLQKKFCLMILNEGNIHQVCQHNLNAWHSRAIHVLQCV